MNVSPAQRYVYCIGLGWLVVLAAALVYWNVMEAAQPGQQYAEPLGPCLLLALTGGTLLGILAALVLRVVAALRGRV